MARIVWTKHERKLVNDRLFELFCIRGDMQRKVALQHAQEVLAPGRRAVITDQRVFNSKMAIERAQAQAAAFSRRNDQPKPEKAPPAPAPINAPTPAPKAKEDPSGGLVEAFERLLDIIADRVAERVLLQLPQATPARPPVPAAPVPNAPTRARPGVWLLGVTPQMGYYLREKYGDRLDIDYLDSDEAAKRTPTPRAHLVMMTRFVSHVVQERWKKQGVLHYCNGGLSALETILDSL